MKRLMALTLLLVSTLTACGGGPQEQTPVAAPASQQPSGSASGSPSGSASGSMSSEPATAGSSVATKVLTGRVGEEGDAEAFTITLEDSSGNPVETLPAGNYQVKISDLATIHNFHLTGPGVDESTSVPETGDVTWDVTLERGSYTFVCDPHPGMKGTIEVT